MVGNEETATESLLRFLGATGQDDPALMTFWNAAFDDSGSIGQHRFVAYAGVIGTAKQWDAFAESWVATLRRESLTYFKMAEAMAWHGEFGKKHSEWGEARVAKRDGLIDALVDISREHGLQAIGVTAEVTILQGRDNTEKKTQLFKSALLTVLKGIPATDHVIVTCDNDPNIEVSIRAWLRDVRKASDTNLPALAAVCFADDRIYPALQLADMVAWLFRATAENGAITGSAVVTPEPLKKLLGNKQLEVSRATSMTPATLIDAIRKVSGDGE